MASQPQALRELVLAFLERRRRHASLTVDEFLAGRTGADAGLRQLLDEAMTWPAHEVDRRLKERLGAGAHGIAEPERTAPIPESTQPIRDEADFDGRYRIVRAIGEGGFGRVYLVEDELHGSERLALKLILEEHTSPEFEQRFRNEIRVLRALSHEGIPQIFNDGKTKAGELYYTMSFVEGRSLSDVLKKEAPLAPDRIVRLVRQILLVLDYAHGKGVVHRDLKPANIILEKAGAPEEHVHVLDFGIAKILRQEGILEQAKTMQTQVPLGTPHYMAPEQVRGQKVDGRTDIYALGIIIYQMCSGRLPFSGATVMEILAARLERPPTPLSTDDAPQWLTHLVMRLLEREQEKRPTTEQLRVDLERLAAGQRSLGHGLRWIGAAVALIALGLAWMVIAGPSRANGDRDDDHEVMTGGSEQMVDPDPAPQPLPPSVTIESPSDGSQTKGDPVVVFAAEHLERVLVGDDEVLLSSLVGEDGTYRHELGGLEEGERVIKIRALDAGPADEPLATTTIVVDRTDPVLVWGDLPGRPVSGARYLREHAVQLTGRVSDAPPGRLDRFQIDGDTVPWDQDGAFQKSLSLPLEGRRTVEVELMDAAGNGKDESLELVVDTISPEISLVESPAETTATSIRLEGRVSDDNLGDRVWIIPEREVEDLPDTLPEEDSLALRDGAFVTERLVERGPNSWVLVAEDLSGNRTTRRVSVVGTLQLEVAAPPTRVEAGTKMLTVSGSASRELSCVRIERGSEPPVDHLPSSEKGFEYEWKLDFGLNTIRLTPIDRDGVDGEAVPLSVDRARASKPPGFDTVDEDVDDSGWAKRVRERKTGLDFVLVTNCATCPFYMSVYEVSRQAYTVFGGEPGRDAEETHPVVNVTAAEAEGFASRLGGRLPTVDEWRDAAGGSGEAYPWGRDWSSDVCNNRGWMKDHRGTCPVGQPPTDVSRAGIHGMGGNVREWCRGEEHEFVTMGGSFLVGETDCRIDANPKVVRGKALDLGFRIVVPATE